MHEEPTKEMLDYAQRHNLRYNPVARGGWCFDYIGGSVPFSMHYSEIEAAAKEEAEIEKTDNL